MQIDPAALSRTDSASTTIASSKSTAPNAPPTQKSTKALISVPRLDLEPIYTELKAAIGDNWADYKEATSLFLLGMSVHGHVYLTFYLRESIYTVVLDIPVSSYLLISLGPTFTLNAYADAALLSQRTGQLNQSELSSRVDHIICADQKTEHLHNNFVCAIIGNLTRDLPDHGVASWVSANDKPSVVSKPTSGDAAEQRLKTEVMQLPPRDRRRIKAIPEVCDLIQRCDSFPPDMCGTRLTVDLYKA